MSSSFGDRLVASPRSSLLLYALGFALSRKARRLLQELATDLGRGHLFGYNSFHSREVYRECRKTKTVFVCHRDCRPSWARPQTNSRALPVPSELPKS